MRAQVAPARDAASRGRVRAWISKFASAFLVGLLRSPLHRIVSGSLLVINVRGRRSGRHYELPAMYARDGDTLWIYCGQAEGKSWWRNLREKSDVAVWLGGRQRRAVAQVVDGRLDLAGAIAGLSAWLDRFPSAARRIGIAAKRDGSWLTELAEVVQRDILVRVTLTSEPTPP
jgi:hypothetical protein